MLGVQAAIKKNKNNPLTLLECQQNGKGLLATGVVDAHHCHAAGNCGGGMFAQQGAHLIAEACTIVDSVWFAYHVTGAFSQMRLTSCSCTRYHGGCCSSADCTVNAHELSVSDCETMGIQCVNGAKATLSKCTVERCQNHGLTAMSEGTDVEVEDSRFNDTGSCGVVDHNKDAVGMTRCSTTSQNKVAGYYTSMQGNLSVWKSPVMLMQ